MANDPSSESKSVPPGWKLIVDQEMIDRCISRLSYEVVERKGGVKNLAIVGIRTGGEHIARRLHARIQEIEKVQISFGVIDITLYRDDLSNASSQPILRATDLPFPVNGSRIVLTDDVLYTGRTVRSALDAIVDFGRPDCVELAVLADRGHRELPIRADYVGKNLPTKRNEFVRVRLRESGYPEDGVYLISRSTGKKRSGR
jgi:pyrimidine operon attenuation protein / uracil phosphoribosyltransferase